MAQRKFGAASALAVGAFALLVLEPRTAVAQTYQVSVEETGALATAYTKRFNWRYYLTVYRHTTMIAVPNTNLCNESPCLDDNLPGGGLPPDGTRGGTASAKVSGMSAGTYRLELRYNKTVNRATSVPWKITTDAASNNSRSGNLDQKNTTPGTGNWLVLGQTGQNPIHVESSASFVFGTDTITLNGSLSYGGIRLVRLGPLPTPSDGGVDGGASDAAADAAGDANPDAAADAAEDSSSDAEPDVFVPSDAASSDGADPLDGSAGSPGIHSGVIPVDDAGCACRVGQGQPERGPLALLVALSAALGALRRRPRRLARRVVVTSALGAIGLAACGSDSGGGGPSNSGGASGAAVTGGSGGSGAGGTPSSGGTGGVAGVGVVDSGSSDSGSSDSGSSDSGIADTGSSSDAAWPATGPCFGVPVIELGVLPLDGTQKLSSGLANGNMLIAEIIAPPSGQSSVTMYEYATPSVWRKAWLSKNRCEMSATGGAGFAQGIGPNFYFTTTPTDAGPGGGPFVMIPGQKYYLMLRNLTLSGQPSCPLNQICDVAVKAYPPS